MIIQSVMRFYSSRSDLQKMRVLPVFLLLTLLGSQLLTLQHDHDGDLSHHADCSVCIQLKTGTDTLIASGLMPQAVSHSDAIASAIPALQFASLLPAKSRSPPR